eukprot:COSAG01_NODE_23296_length_820_cov_1.983356_1_plen_60_part_00
MQADQQPAADNSSRAASERRSLANPQAAHALTQTHQIDLCYSRAEGTPCGRDQDLVYTP